MTLSDYKQSAPLSVEALGRVKNGMRALEIELRRQGTPSYRYPMLQEFSVRGASHVGSQPLQNNPRVQVFWPHPKRRDSTRHFNRFKGIHTRQFPRAFTMMQYGTNHMRKGHQLRS